MEFTNDTIVQKKWASYLKSYVLIILFAMLLTLLTSLIFGYKFFIVNGYSAEPYIHFGSLAIVKKPTEVEIGDFVTYSKNGQTFVTHRVVEVREDNTFLVSQTGGQLPDQIVLSVNDNYVVGKVVFAIPYVNNILNYAKKYFIQIILLVAGLSYAYNYFSNKETYQLEEQ